MKRLNELFNIDNDMKIYSIHSDSRYVKPYSIFFCIEGLSVDGHRYVDDAIFQGAKVIVHSKDIEKQPGIIYIKVADALDELNRVSNVFYDYPSKKMRVVGVTGTSGKTVVASMVKSVMDHYCKAAYMGTISLEYDGVEEQCPYTTPETYKRNCLIWQDVVLRLLPWKQVVMVWHLKELMQSILILLF